MRSCRESLRRCLASLPLSILLGCSTAPVPEPGEPPLPPSPLFPGYGSYATIESLAPRLPARSAWRVLTDSKGKPRRGCPRFDELTFVVGAEHLGYRGTLQLRFINDRLEQTLFTPDESGGYIGALRRTGPRLADGRSETIAPATRVWLSDPVVQPRYVGWRDERFASQVEEWIRTCA